MCKFVSALVPKDGNKSSLFKNEKTLKNMFSESYKVTDDFPSICHGFWEHYYSVRVLEHGGNTDSSSSQIAFAPEKGLALALVIMTNQAHERSLCYGLKDGHVISMYQEYGESEKVGIPTIASILVPLFLFL